MSVIATIGKAVQKKNQPKKTTKKAKAE